MVSQHLSPHTMSIFETADDIFIRQISLPSANVMYPQHVHSWDHTTVLVKGSIVLWRGERPAEYFKAPALVFIERNIEHRFQTLEADCLILCVHNLRAADGALRDFAALDDA